MDVIFEENISIVSFAFDVLDQDWITKLKKKNVILIGTTTHLQEAILLKSAGIDIVVARGIEVGSHRGTFLSDAPMSRVLLHGFVFQLTRDLEILIIVLLAE